MGEQRRNFEVMEGNLTYGQNHELNKRITQAKRVGDTTFADLLEHVRSDIKEGKTKFTDHMPVLEQTYESLDVQEQAREAEKNPGIGTKIWNALMGGGKS
jgi:hypothetical protein